MASDGHVALLWVVKRRYRGILELLARRRFESHYYWTDDPEYAEKCAGRKIAERLAREHGGTATKFEDLSDAAP